MSDITVRRDILGSFIGLVAENASLHIDIRDPDELWIHIEANGKRMVVWVRTANYETLVCTVTEEP